LVKNIWSKTFGQKTFGLNAQETCQSDAKTIDRLIKH
jgi:hypothetical protein